MSLSRTFTRLRWWVGHVRPLRMEAAESWPAPGSPLPPSAAPRESILVLILFMVLVLVLCCGSSVNTNATPDCFK